MRESRANIIAVCQARAHVILEARRGAKGASAAGQGIFFAGTAGLRFKKIPAE